MVYKGASNGNERDNGMETGIVVVSTYKFMGYADKLGRVAT